MRLKPLQDRLVVRRRDEDERGGIALPAGIRSERHEYGEVIAIGPGTRFADGTLLAPAVAVGDTVLYAKDSGEALIVDREVFRLLREGDVIGILGAAPLVAVARVAL